MKNTSHFVLWITVLTIGYITMLLPIQAQTEWVEIKRGSGTLDGGNPSWTFFTVDLLGYSSGNLAAHISVESGTGISRTGDKCWGGAQFAEEGFFNPENKKPYMSNIITRILQPNQTTKINGDFSKPTKFILGVIPTCKPGISSKFEYVIYIKNGKRVSTASKSKPIPAISTPCNDGEIQVNYDKKSPKYHHYGPLETQLCLTTNPNCNLSSVFSTMISMVKYVTPVFSSSPVKNCMEIDANPNPLESDLVRIVVDTDKFSITNYTRRKHQFYPGEVRRTIVEKRGAIYVITEGEGTGEKKAKNLAMAPALWQEIVDDRLKAGVTRMLLKQRSQ